MKCVSKIRFVSYSFGTTKPKDDKPSQNYYIVNFIDDDNNNYRYFVFEGTELYRELVSGKFQFGQELVAVISINSYNNMSSLVSLEVQANGK
ncbi:MAG: hypothetical protein IJ867_01675 [Clostridia bacterium]|nr:hypothetical protein [Clostridia bacterium]